MKIAVVSTVAYHPRGLDMHLRDIAWAVDRDHDVHIFTRQEYDFSRPGVRFHSMATAVPHVDYHNAYLPALADEYDVLLLLQLDFPLIRKCGLELDRCFAQGSFTIPEHAWSDYFGIFRNQKLVYPRLWEGGVIFSGSFLREACQLGISCGFGIRQFGRSSELRERFAEVLRTHEYRFGVRQFVSLWEHLSNPVASRPYCDLMTELGVYAFCAGYSPLRCSAFANHLPGIETLHRKYRDIYERPELLLEVDVGFECQRYFTALMLLLSGVAAQTAIEPILENMRNKPGARELFINRLAILQSTAHHWMTPFEQENLSWAITLARELAMEDSA